MGTALLVTAAAALLESVPFLTAAAVLLALPLSGCARMLPYLGCGCGAGASARSLPAAAAASFIFGPAVAGARFAAAAAVHRIPFLSRRHAHARAEPLLPQLAVLLPVTFAAAGVQLFAPALFGMRPAPAAAFAGGALAAFLMAPCGLGAVAFAASLRHTLPAAAAGFLCIAGIADLRLWTKSHRHGDPHDALAYLLAALACANAAAHHGAGMLSPLLAAALWPCAMCCAALAYRFRNERSARLRLAPIAMLLGTVLAAPPPVYHATETTLAGAFAGERVDFTGVATQTGGATTLVRYAITCCRADAAPIVLRLDRSHPHMHGWIHARGTLVAAGSELRLHVQLLQKIAAPADPFVYR